MKVLCALNPTASAGQARERWPQIAALLQGMGVSYDLLQDPNIPLEEQLIAQLKESVAGKYSTILGIGGDGTHSALINALLHFVEKEHLAIPSYAIIPMGTGNDIAKSFGLANRENFFVSDLRRAVSTAIYGAEYDLDAGVLNDRYFVDAFTIGVDSSILREHNIQKKRIHSLGLPFLRKTDSRAFSLWLSHQ